MTFNSWAKEKARIVKEKGKNPCRVEQSLNCLPLEKDPICRACYEADTSAVIPAKAGIYPNDIPPGEVC